MVRSNSIIHNPRVGKIVKSLSKRYSISALGWNRDNVKKEKICAYNVPLRLLKFRAPFGTPYLVAYFPIYWSWVLIQLLFKFRPEVIHACDLDSAIPCYIYKIIARKRLIFDVCDRYAMGYIPPRHKILYSLVNSLEELIAKNSDVLVNVSEKLQATFQKRPRSCEVIMNCSEDHAVDTPVQARDAATMKVVYTGNIIKNRGLQQIASVIKEVDGVEFVIAGRDIDKDLLNQLLKIPNVKYEGLLDLTESWKLQANSDVMVSMYDLKDPISFFSMGNKIFEAMMFGVPIITNVAAEVINEADCGILVNYNDEDQIKSVILNLRDNTQFRKTLANNGRNSFLAKYNWTVMENRLFGIYDKMHQKVNENESPKPRAR